MGRSGDQQIESRTTDEAAQTELNQIGAGDEKHRASGQHNENRRSEIGLKHDQAGDPTDQHTKGNQTVRHLPHLFALGREPNGNVDNDGQLRWFTWLERSVEKCALRAKVRAAEQQD